MLKMIQKILLFTVFAAVYCQYPEQRAPPLRHRPPPEEYEEYAPPPRQAPPSQAAFRPNPRAADVYKPASVHYVNIGLELAGDYKFGYDTGKGNEQSFREETRLPDGTVQGAYGYIDETGRQRIVKYTAGKDGFKAEGDVGPEGAPKAPRAYPAPAPAQAQPAPQPAPRPAPQAAYAPQPAPRPAPQPAYVPQQAPRPQPQAAYRPPPPAQPAYNPPPQPQPAYRAPEPEYRPRPRPQASRPRPAPRPVEAYEEPDYDYPNNDITERRLVPVDTSLFTYNIGTSQDKRN